MNVLQLWLPILLSGMAVFFLSFLSWMVLQLHKNDWRRLPNENEFLKSAAVKSPPPGNYMFPMPCEPGKFDDEFKGVFEAGPWGSLQLYHSKPNMATNLGLTFVYFTVVSFCLAYLASFSIGPKAEWMKVFRFISTAGLMTYLAAIVPHSIWFRVRIAGHVIESIAFAAATGAIFASLWPS